MSSRRFRVLTLVWLGAPLLGACSVVAGWSDLQGGERESDARRTSPDAESSSVDASSRDASGEDADAAPAPQTDPDPCGAECNGALGCCIRTGIGRECTTADACQSAGSFFLRCQTSAECGADSSCCLSLKTLLAGCRPTCELGDYVLCDPAGTDCNGSCRSSGIADVFRCR